MQLFAHLLSSYLQGMGDFFSALGRAREGPSMNSRPLGMAREGLSMSSRTLEELGGSSTSCCFCTASGGLFERPTAAFFYRRGCCRHAEHDGGDGGDDTEENPFSDGRYHQRHPGEADSCHHGFLYFGITLFFINDCNICRCPADVPAAVTPSAKRNSYRVAILLCTNTQGRGAAHLNPGLRNRNSYRVAGRKPHPGLPQGEGTQCQWIRG